MTRAGAAVAVSESARGRWRRVDGSLVDAWEELASRTGASPFMHPGWILAWHRAFGTGRLEAITATRSGDLAALLPLEVSRWRIAAPANWHSPSFEVLSDGPDPAAEVLAGAVDRRSPLVDLRFVADGGPTARALAAAHGRGGPVARARVLERPPFVRTDVGPAEFESSLAGRFRRELGRRRRRLCERGELAVEVHDGTGRPEALDRLLDEGLVVEASGWKGAAGTAISSRPETAGFYRDVAHWAAARGWLRLAFLRLDGRPLAFDLALEDGRCHYLLKCGYDPAFRAASPGQLLRREMILRAIGAGLESYELLGEFEPWKRDWTSSARTLLDLQVFAPTVAGRGAQVAMTWGRPLAKRARDLVRGSRSRRG